MHKLLSASALALAIAAAPAAARPLTIQDVTMLSRISAPVVSNDGRWLVWEQRETDLDADKGRTDLWTLDLSARRATPQKLAADPQVDETAPQLSEDGATVFFQSNAGGEDNVWSVPVAGGAPRQLTHLKGGIGGFKVAPTGDKLLIWADRGPGAPSSEPPTVKKATDAGAGRTYDQLFVRHWSSWSDGTRSQIYVLPLTTDGATGYGTAIEGPLVGDTPSKPFGDGSEISWSRDGKTIFFALREAGRIEPLSTNLDIFAAPADGSAPPVNLTAANRATDTLPAMEHASRRSEPLSMLLGKAPWDGQEHLTDIADSHGLQSQAIKT